MFDSSQMPVRSDIRARIDVAMQSLSEPGTWLGSGDRIRAAQTARAARSDVATDPSDALEETANVIGAEPASTTEGWVTRMVSELGNEETYVEVMGIATRTVMIDTFSRLLGYEPPPFPHPTPGEPSRREVEPRPKRVRSWISVGSSLVPPFTQILVPDENAVTYPLIESLYMTDADMADPDFARGALHRTQIEFVAAIVSYANECFY